MILDARDWLPPQVAERPAVRGKAAEAVEVWRRKWFVDLPLEIVRWDLVDGDLYAAPEAGGRVFGGAIGAHAGARAIVRLIEAAMDASLVDGTSEADRRVIDAVATEMVADLVATLGSGWGLDPRQAAVPARAGVRAALGSGGGVMLWVFLPMPVLMALGQASLPAPRAPVGALADRRRALGDQPVEIEAVLGGARLRLRDLASLAPGDVLVLDRKLGEPAALRHRESGRLVAHAELSDAEGALELVLQPAQSTE